VLYFSFSPFATFFFSLLITMVQLALAFVAAVLVSVQASPSPQKRIAQVIDQSLVKWQSACLSATKGSLDCNRLAVGAFETLLAGAGTCAQQNAADGLISFAKQQENSAEMIRLAQIFCQQPRNSPNSVSIPYCQQPPSNPELKGLFQCQFIGNNPNVFVGNVKLGAPGTIPLGRTSPPSPLGSCPAHPEGGIEDGIQLSSITTTPIASGSILVTAGSNATDPGSDGIPSIPSKTSDNVVEDGNCPSSTTSTTVSDAMPSNSGTTVLIAAPSIQLQNGRDAQSLNLKFSTLNPNSPCDPTETSDACIGGEFAQCVFGKFSLVPCNENTECFALPLVNSRGTSVTCDTLANALFRIGNSGATGGLTGQ